MKNAFKIIGAVILLHAGIPSMVGQTGIIANDAAIVDWGWGSQHDNILTLTQSIPHGQGLFAIAINKVTPTFIPTVKNITFDFSSQGIAEAYRLFQVMPGDIFNPDFANQRSPLVSNDPRFPSSAQLTFAINESKYFAYWDDRQLQHYMSPPDALDSYGWVRLTRNGLNLVVSESATAMGGGIIVGSYVQIPEPSTVAMVLGSCSLLMVALTRRKPTGVG